MKIELKIYDEEEIEKHAEHLIKFAKPQMVSETHKIYNIKDSHIPGLVWIICKKKEEISENT